MKPRSLARQETHRRHHPGISRCARRAGAVLTRFHRLAVLSCGSLATLQPGAKLTLSGDRHRERAVYVVSGEASIGDTPLASERLHILKQGLDITVTAHTPTNVLLLGGHPAQPKQMWSTVVARTLDRIERATADWAEGRIPSVIGETDHGAFPPSM